MLRLANQLVKGEFFSTVTIFFLAKRYTKNSYDRNFSIIKKIYYKRNVVTKDEVLKIHGKSECDTIIYTTPDFSNDLGSL